MASSWDTEGCGARKEMLSKMASEDTEGFDRRVDWEERTTGVKRTDCMEELSLHGVGRQGRQTGQLVHRGAR